MASLVAEKEHRKALIRGLATPSKTLRGALLFTVSFSPKAYHPKAPEAKPMRRAACS
jgi:hypothetical protein